MSFALVYVLLGVGFLLGDIAKAAAQGTSFSEQLKASFYLSDDDLRYVVVVYLLWIVAWPILLVAQSGGPPTRGAT
jgi:hypothetical protein